MIKKKNPTDFNQQILKLGAMTVNVRTLKNDRNPYTRRL